MPPGHHPRWFLLTGPKRVSSRAAIASLFQLAHSQSRPGFAPDPRGQKRPCLGTVVCLCVETQPSLHGQHHTSIMNMGVTLQASLFEGSGKILDQQPSGWKC